jgi:hypothetical protein
LKKASNLLTFHPTTRVYRSRKAAAYPSAHAPPLDVRFGAAVGSGNCFVFYGGITDAAPAAGVAEVATTALSSDRNAASLAVGPSRARPHGPSVGSPKPAGFLDATVTLGDLFVLDCALNQWTKIRALRRSDQGPSSVRERPSTRIPHLTPSTLKKEKEKKK